MTNESHIGMGHGVEGRFGGLPDEYFALDKAAIILLPVAFDKTTTYQKGSDKGPEAVIEASRNLELYDIETDSEVYKNGIHTAQEIQKSTSEEMLKETYQTTAELLNNGKFVVTLGGEHSISPALIRAYAEKFPGLSVLQLDAHADLQPAYEGNPLSHASAMSRVKEIPQVSNFVAVGIRSMSSNELEYMDRSRTYFAHNITGRDDWIDKVIDQLGDAVYITLDLDVFDPSIMPSTGTPEPGGLDWYTVLKLIRMTAQRKQIVGFDVVELCPNPNNKAPDFMTAKLIYKILSYIFTTNPTREKSK